MAAHHAGHPALSSGNAPVHRVLSAPGAAARPEGNGPMASHPAPRACPGFLLVLMVAAALPAAAADLEAAPPVPSWSFDLRSNGYAYQGVDAAGETSDEFRFYQHFAGTASGLAGGGLTFRTAGRFANTPGDAGPLYETSRLHTGLLELRLGGGWRAQAGRQFLQSGVAGLTLDGVGLVHRGRGGLEASVWGGGAVPSGHAFALADFDQDAAAGGRIVLRPARNHRLGLSAAYRERHGVVAVRPVGCEYSTTAVRGLRALARASYDLEGERWVRLEAQGRWQKARTRPLLSLQYVDRYPTVDAASWFSRFTEPGADPRPARGHALGERRPLRRRTGVPGRLRGRPHLEPRGPGGPAAGRAGGLLPAGGRCRRRELGVRRGRLAGPPLAAPRGRGLVPDLRPAGGRSGQDQERDLVTLAARARLNLRSGLRHHGRGPDPGEPPIRQRRALPAGRGPGHGPRRLALRPGSGRLAVTRLLIAAPAVLLLAFAASAQLPDRIVMPHAPTSGTRWSAPCATRASRPRRPPPNPTGRTWTCAPPATTPRTTTACAMCHTNVDEAGDYPTAAFGAELFAHAAHAGAGIACAACHGDPAAAAPALPGKPDCRACHETADAYADCRVCHAAGGTCCRPPTGRLAERSRRPGPRRPAALRRLPHPDHLPGMPCRRQRAAPQPSPELRLRPREQGPGQRAGLRRVPHRAGVLHVAATWPSSASCRTAIRASAGCAPATAASTPSTASSRSRAASPATTTVPTRRPAPVCHGG